VVRGVVVARGAGRGFGLAVCVAGAAGARAGGDACAAGARGGVTAVDVVAGGRVCRGAAGTARRAAARRAGRARRRSRTVGCARTVRTVGAWSGASLTPALTGSELRPTGWRASRLAPSVSPAVKAIPTTASAQTKSMWRVRTATG
jgi:hypothetical protein